MGTPDPQNIKNDGFSAHIVSVKVLAEICSLAEILNLCYTDYICASRDLNISADETEKSLLDQLKNLC